MEDVFLHVDETWTQPAAFTFVNIPNHYAFVKTDHEGNPLAGVKFALEDEDGNHLCELESDADGVVHATDLMPGIYVIRETETLADFIRTDETIEVVIDENYIPPEGKELFHLINYPGIQTGVEFTVTPVMWAGAALMLSAAALAGVYCVQNKKKRRKGRRGHR